MPQEAKLDHILTQWRRERPDLDTDCMAVCGEVWRTGRRLMVGLQPNLDRFELDFPALDVLLTLRRQGKGQRLSPSGMAADMMLSNAAMTARLDKLQARALIERHPDPDDRRGIKIALTKSGFRLAEEVVSHHVDAENAMLEKLDRQDRDKLVSLLAKIATN